MSRLPASKLLRVIFLAVSGVLGSAASADSTCQRWPIASGGNGHWYQRFDRNLTWPQARDACLAMGGHLATVVSKGEQDFVAVINDNRNCFLGGYRISPGGPWAWVTGEAWSYTNWLINEPSDAAANEPYLHYWLESSGWNDIRPDFTGSFICEWVVDCDLNDLPDGVEVLSGRDFDGDADGTLDACESSRPLPKIRQFSIVRGACNQWDTSSTEGVWNVYLARGGEQAPLLNGTQFDPTVEVRLQPGRNEFTLFADASKCSDEPPVLAIWFDLEPSPNVAVNRGSPCTAATRNVLNGRTGGFVQAPKLADAVVNGWRVKVESFEWDLQTSTDRVGPAQGLPNGAPDLRGQMVILVDGDCNQNGIPDSDEIAGGTEHDCDGDALLDSCEIAAGAPDCNGNGVPDTCDITSGLSRDIDHDGRPDECEFDCNRNISPDDYDIATGASADCNGNGIPDECEDGSVHMTTGSMSRFGNGVSAEGQLVGALPAASPVTVTVRARGDLNGTTEFAIVKFAGQKVANFFVAGGRDCPVDFDSETVVIAPAAWNDMLAAAAASGVPVSVTGSPLVDADQCAASFVEVIVDYKTARYDCNGDGVSDLCQIASGALADCDRNGVPDLCDIGSGAAADVDQDGVPDRCQPDCNGNALPDSWEIATGRVPDCNGNGLPDSCDIAAGSSNDVDGNGVPDECQPDCNGDGRPDAWQVQMGEVPDCNANGQPDSCDLASGFSRDQDGDGRPDECQPDCNGNMLPDPWEVTIGQAPDCNGNGVPDSCDIASGFARDCDANGVPDDCDIARGDLDEDHDGRPDRCQIAYGDFDLDGQVTMADVGYLLLVFGDVNSPFGDMDGDGIVTTADVSILLMNYGPVP